MSFNFEDQTNPWNFMKSIWKFIQMQIMETSLNLRLAIQGTSLNLESDVIECVYMGKYIFRVYMFILFYSLSQVE